MNARTQKWISILCVLALMIGLVPMTVSAAVEEIPVETVEEVPAETVGTMPDFVEPEESATLLASCCSRSDPHDYIGTIDMSSDTGTSSEHYVLYPADAKSGTLIVGSNSGNSDWTVSGPVTMGSKTSVNSKKALKVTVTGTGDAVIANKEYTFTLHIIDSLHVHQWGDWTVTKEASCTETGNRTHTCTDTACPGPNTAEEEIPALGHDFSVDVAAVPATCVNPGTTAGKKCSRCDETQGITEIPANGQHNYVDGKCEDCGLDAAHVHDFTGGETVTTKEPTCTETGVTETRCKDYAQCGGTQPGTLPAKGHTLTATPVSIPGATQCTVAGNNAYWTCSVCHKVYADAAGTTETTVAAQAIPAKGHKDANNDGKCDACGNEMSTSMTGAGGWFETLYVDTNQFTPSQVTAVSWSGPMMSRLSAEDRKFLVRSNGKGGTRIDIPGVLAGEGYTLKVTASGNVYEANNITVMEHDRSGYAHFNYTEGVGAYRDDGMLKENAIVLYVTEENKNTVTLEAPDGTVVTGIGNILNTAGMDTGGGTTSKGGKANSNQDILKKLGLADIPLVVRIVGTVKSVHPAPKEGGIVGLTDYDSLDNGGSTGDQGNMARMKDAKNITIEGIGPDAVVDGWGFHFMASKGYPNLGKSFEARNLTFRNVPEDCIGMEGQHESKVAYNVERGWVHNCSFYGPNISPATEGDKTGGDGACDFKRGEYFTMDYCYYEGYHKTNLVGSGDSESNGTQHHITWHHNYYKNCEARGPLGRKANMHIYNCIYENQVSYAQNTRTDGYIFSEYNSFQMSKQPRGVEGGAIKSYMDALRGCIEDGKKGGPATDVTDRLQKVTSGNLYESFELDSNVSYIPTGDYKLDKDHIAARANVMAYAGPMKATVVTPDQVNPSVVLADRVPTAAMVLPYNIIGTDGKMKVKNATGTVDNMKINIQTPSDANLKFGKEDGGTKGQNIVFKVDEYVDITVEGTGIALVNEAGAAVLAEPGTAKDLAPGVYFIEPNNMQPDKNGGTPTWKDGSLTGLTIQAAANHVEPHVHSFGTPTKTKDATCMVEGLMTATCACGETETTPIEKKDHNYSNGVCIWCGLPDGVVNGDPDAPEIHVTAVEIKSDSTQDPIPLLQDTTIQLSAVITPGNATDRSVEWTSSNPTVATVSNRGMVTAKSAGAATITVTTNDGQFTDSVNVKVTAIKTTGYTFNAPTAHPDAQTEADQSAAGGKYGTSDYFTLSGTGNTWKAQDFKGGKKNTVAVRLASQEGGALEFTVPAECASATVTLTFRSTSKDNSSAIGILDATGALVSTVDGDRLGTVTGTGNASVKYTLSPGTYKIVSPKGVLPSEVDPDLEAFGSDGKNNPNTRAVELVSANVLESRIVGDSDIVTVSGLSLDKETASLEVGDVLPLTATVTPSNATFQTVSWKSSNNAVATVSQGAVTAWGTGTATITAECSGFTATCVVTVSASTSQETKVQSIRVTGPNNATSTALTLNEAEQTVALTVQVLPADADDTRVSWTVAPTGKGVNVNTSGVVTIADDAEAGSYTVTATAKDGSNVKGTYTITLKAGDCKHAETEVRGAKAATCTAKGYTGDTWCTVCNNKIATGTEIPALGHDTELRNVKAATCKETGYTGDTVCKVCEKVIASGETVNKTSDHSYADGVCTICGAAEGEEHTEHTFGEWQVTKKATCTAEGEEARYCTYGGCNEKETRKLEKLAHDYDADGVCTVCGAEKPSTPAPVGGSGSSIVIGSSTKTETLADGTKVTTTELSGGAKESIVRPDGTKADMTYNKDGSATGTVTLTDGTKATVTTTKDGETTAKVTVPAKVDSTNVTIPAQNVTPGTVAVIVKDDGTEELVRMSAVDEVGVKVKLDDSATVKLVDKAVKFVDVPGHWAEAKVDFVSARDLFKGTDAIHFTPNGTMTRAMMATVLYRLDGERKGDAKESFADVNDGTWYTDAVAWANGQGIVTGYSDAAFGPEDNVTREQLAVMIYRYAKAEGLVSGEKTAELTYADAGRVNSWATEAVSWLTANGILTGKPGNLVDPQGNASRAEVATVLQRFVEFATK